MIRAMLTILTPISINKRAQHGMTDCVSILERVYMRERNELRYFWRKLQTNFLSREIASVDLKFHYPYMKVKMT